MKDIFAPKRAPLRRNWSLWHGAILPCYVKTLCSGEPRLVGLYFRTASVTRCVVRLEWRDGNHWVREALDAPWHVHATGEDASREWADFICEKVLIEWSVDELNAELNERQKGVA